MNVSRTTWVEEYHEMSIIIKVKGMY